MKKTFYAFVCAIIFASILPSLASAEMYLPKSISVGSPVTYNAGDTVNISITNSSNPIGLQKNIEYGVARTTDIDGLTYFENITTEYADISKAAANPSLSVVIPNIISEDATSTYVVYTKYFEKNAPENESFYFTKNFTITPNNTPFVKIGNVNLLQSNGGRFSTLHGPTIYTPAEAAQDKLLATSSSIEITLQSNTDTTIVPNLSFTKLRSGAFKKDISLPPITIKKGKTYTVLPLPTFDYEPGVYLGQLSFTSNLLKNKVDFQYIVAGDAVSVGTVVAAEKDKVESFVFEIFGRTIDLDRIVGSSTIPGTPTKDMYTVKIDFVDDKGSTIYTTTQQVDFALNEFSVAIPEGTGKVAKIGVAVSAIGTGKVVYTAVKDVIYEGQAKQPIKAITYAYFAIYVLLMIIGILAISGKHIKTAIFCILVMIGMFVSQKSFASLISITPYRTAYGNSIFTAEGLAQVPSIHLQDDVVNTTYTCGETIPFVFKTYYIRCTNSVPNMRIGFSWDKYVTPTQTLTNSVSQNIYIGNVNGHLFYRSYSPFIAKTLTPPITNPDSLYVSLNHSGDSYWGNTTTGYSRYTIPVKTTCTPQSTVCSCSGRTQICYQNGSSISTTTNHASCALQASCTYTTSGNNVTFDTIVTNALKSLSYRDNVTNRATTKTVTKSRVGTSTVSHNVTVTDSFDKTTAIAVCSTDSVVVQPTQPPTVGSRGPATITSFRAEKPVVPKNTDCKYSWNVVDVDQCTLSVSNSTILNQNVQASAFLDVVTANGLNQRATITCIANAIAASGTTPASPAVTVSTTTLCQVLPEVIER